ncbi:class I SAM-dependent RNA methyltransferase [Aestuariivirga litoralis]|uniref:class I SAM-dependent RNA methyltransferase n=1 Tax=Aestuariivirga litoralis TaxID=2650924 RepID=UPI0018C69791|nr:methyltransferase [Aestuariivirga litoralis]MBG1232038.1 class I SAM-dependent RNA methyltransferase [Aestuariivirga litoralis]
MSDVTIARMGERGDGLAEGRAFPRTLPGEVVADDGHVITPSPDRVDPFCPVFEVCGGCKTQHWSEEPYRAWKTALLADALKAKGLETKINPLIDAHGEGRRRVALHVRKVNGTWRSGFMEAGTHELVPLETCPILVPRLKNAVEIAAQLGELFGDCDVAVTAAGNGLDLNIKAERKLADKAAIQFGPYMQRHGITRMAVNGEVAGQLQVPVMQMGKGLVNLPIGSFLQATQLGEETLVRLLAEQLRKVKNIADLFCGVGPFALRLAEKVAVTAIDSDRNSISALQLALRYAQGLKPVKAEVRDLFRNPLTNTELNEFDLVALDPPRAGAEAQCQWLAKSKVKRVAYVSCDVQTFARDAALLVAAGYTLNEVTPVDQFKYSPHLELVAAFSRA